MTGLKAKVYFGGICGMKGIPTVYKGIRFRSRLEARWACFFDMIGQKWQYEPYDLAGWIPDFAIQVGRGFKNTLVEVKPTFDNLEELKSKIINSVMKSPSYHDFDILLLGNGSIIQCQNWI